MNIFCRYTLTFLLLLVCTCGFTQSKKEKALSIAFTNTHSAYPFTKFKSLLTEEIHPGLELGYTFNWHTHEKHNWYQTLKVGYFYHRFIQHAIPVYIQLGYRYKLKDHWRFTPAMGAGYLHSIPDAAVLELNENGEYENAKGIGRSQALLNFSLGIEYRFLITKEKAPSVFLNYVQQIQTPFIKSYVPLLPYNSIALGIILPIKI